MKTEDHNIKLQLEHYKMKITRQNILFSRAPSRPEHACEPIEEINGIVFINDSGSTSIHKTIQSILEFSKPIILITGGKDESSDYSYLSELPAELFKQVIYLGENSTKIMRQFVKISGVEFHHFPGDLEKSVKHALENGKEGELVLFSPGCPSFDVFDNFKNRGNKFKEIVKSLKVE